MKWGLRPPLHFIHVVQDFSGSFVPVTSKRQVIREVRPMTNGKKRLLLALSPKTRNALIAMLFVIPCAFFIILFRFYPVIYSFRYSLYNYNIMFPDSATFAGLANYKFAFFRDTEFYNSVYVTVKYALMKVVFQLVPGFFLALFLRQRFKLSGALRTALLTPTVTSLVVVTVMWSILLNPHSGLINSVLQTFGIPRQPFLSSSKQALPSLLAMTVWKDMGYVVIIFLSGLLEIPGTLYEQASIDGANAWVKTIRITIPLMKRTFLFLATMMTIWSFKVFTPIYLTTEGGPARSTNALVYYIYENAFVFMDMGYALALSILLMIIAAVFSAFYFRVFRTED